ncbi:MAG TPA: ABC transporter permease [bacterium]|nr:ABC transporter permease [bacterium]
MTAPPRSPTRVRLGARRFRRNRRAVVGLGVLIVLAVVTLCPGLLTSRTPNDVDLTHSLVPPDAQHWFGTDNVGRDYLARALYGGRVSMAIGLAAMAISVVVGTVVGSVAGYVAGYTDEAISRAVDFVLSLPLFYVIVVIEMIFHPGAVGLVVLIGLTSWMVVARLVRGLVLSEKETEYVQAARAMGAPAARVIILHLLPNILGPVIVTASFNVGNAILLESALSFLGVGIQPPQATWGNMIIGAQTYLFSAPWIAIFPGILITATVMAFMFVGDGLRDAFDVRMSVTR